MGLISRVSSRTYRNGFTYTALRFSIPWGKNARPYYVNGLIRQELTHTQAKIFPDPVGRAANLWRRIRKESPAVILAGAPFYFLFTYMEELDYHYHRKGGGGDAH